MVTAETEIALSCRGACSPKDSQKWGSGRGPYGTSTQSHWLGFRHLAVPYIPHSWFRKHNRCLLSCISPFL